MSAGTLIHPELRDPVLRSLSAGVTPKTGLQLLQVGRADEVKAILRDVDCILRGEAFFRLVEGTYGSGKTFVLLLVSLAAQAQGAVVTSVDLTPDRRLHGSQGQALALFRECVSNLSTKSSPRGGALKEVLEAFKVLVEEQAQREGREFEEVLQERLEPLCTRPGGADFVKVVKAYCTGEGEHTEDSLRWFRGEYTDVREARRRLGVGSIVRDANYFDVLKVLARLFRLSGYAGLVICVDEVACLLKLSSGQARRGSYERVLGMLNDTLQGGCEGLGIVLGVTPEVLNDRRRGFASYEALATRLARNPFTRDGVVDFSGPVLTLPQLTQEDLFVLLRNIRHIHACGSPDRYALPDEGLMAFMTHCRERIGEAYFRTPRATVVAFVRLLAVLDQNPSADWRALLSTLEVSTATARPAAAAAPNNEPSSIASPEQSEAVNELASFTL